VQILTTLPSVRSPIIHRKGELRPSKPLSEPLRRLHASLQLEHVSGNERAGPPRSLLFVSPDAGDGKSTVVAGLALIQREAGRRVAVIEADFRRPVMRKLLEVDGAQGLAEVLAGTLRRDEAMQQVTRVQPAIDLQAPGSASGGVATVVESADVGSLAVLVGGAVSNPPALLARPAMTDLLRMLSEEYDHVLIDAPPPLAVSDVLPLLGVVDGIVVVARAGHTREVSARRLMQLLARSSSAPLLGLVANAVSRRDMEKYGLSSGYGTRRWPRRGR
jgi:tyrosine-protein kinase